jgi:hypothetical protein
MAVHDELDLQRPLAVDQSRLAVAADGTAAVRIGDIVSPRAARSRPIALQCEHFLAAIRAPVDATPARRDAAVVHTLAAIQRSVREGGATTAVGEAPPQRLSVVPLSSRLH